MEETSEGVDPNDLFQASRPPRGKRSLYGFDWARGFIAPFRPTPDELMEKIFLSISLTREDTIYDLGCGDGRVLILAAKKHQSKGLGFDLDENLLKQARKNAKEEGVQELLEWRKEDLTQLKAESFREASVLFIFLLPEGIRKLLSELRVWLEGNPRRRLVSVKWPVVDIETDALDWNQNFLATHLLDDSTCDLRKSYDIFSRKGFFIYSQKANKC